MGLLGRLFGSSSEISLTTDLDRNGNIVGEKVSYRGQRRSPQSEETSLSYLRNLNRVAADILYNNKYKGSKM